MSKGTPDSGSRLTLPWNKTVTWLEVSHGNGVELLQLQFREGRRITVIDLDAASARALGIHLLHWANAEDKAPGS